METVDQYNRMIEKAPIIEENGRFVHLSDLVNDIFYNQSERFRKQEAMDDLEAIIDYIDKTLYANIEKEVEGLKGYTKEELLEELLRRETEQGC